MTGPQVVLTELRDFGQPAPVIVQRGQLPLHDWAQERLRVVQAAVTAFSADWPRAAATVHAVQICDNVDESMTACAHTSIHSGRVYSYVNISFDEFNSFLLDSNLQTQKETGYTATGDLFGLLMHEFGHVLVNSLIVRADPEVTDTTQGCQVVIDEVCRRMHDVVPEFESIALSKMAQISSDEFISEAFADFYADPVNSRKFSKVMVATVAELWEQPPPRIHGRVSRF